MTGDQIIQIISLVLTALVSIVTLLVRARIIGLEGEVKKLNDTLTVANAMIIDQGLTITNLSQQLAMSEPGRYRTDKPEDWKASPPYKQQK